MERYLYVRHNIYFSIPKKCDISFHCYGILFIIYNIFKHNIVLFNNITLLFFFFFIIILRLHFLVNTAETTL